LLPYSVVFVAYCVLVLFLLCMLTPNIKRKVPRHPFTCYVCCQ
jgi:hypothetical protein